MDVTREHISCILELKELLSSFPISNSVKQGCVLAPTLFSFFLNIMHREAKEDLTDGIYIRFRSDSSLFNLGRLLARTKTNEELITGPLFADDCALLAHKEEALQHIVNHFSDAAENFGLTISLKKTEGLHQPPPRETYHPPHISIDGTNLNAVAHLTYLGSVISNEATVSKDLKDRFSKASSSFGRLSKRARQSHSRSAPPQRSRYTGPSSFPPSCMVQRHGFPIESLLGHWSSFINTACAPSLASNGNTMCRTKKCSRQPACPA